MVCHGLNVCWNRVQGDFDTVRWFRASGSWGKLVVICRPFLGRRLLVLDGLWAQAWVADSMKPNRLNVPDRFWYADIPMPNTAIAAGDPVCTILAQAESCQQVLQTLAKQSRLCL